MRKLLCPAALLLLLFSCSKSDSPTPNPPPPPPPPPVNHDSSVMEAGWTKIQVINTALSDVTWIDANRLAMTAPYVRQIFSSNDGGKNWLPFPQYAYGVNITSRPNGRVYWTVGVPNYTWINRYQNGVIDSASFNKIAPDLVLLDDSIGYASLTSAPGLAQTHNGGDTWELANTGTTNFGSCSYSTLFFVDTAHALMSFDTRVYYTNQGISNWKQSTISAPTASNIYCSKVDIVSPNISYAGFSDGSLFRSTDTGKSFAQVLLPFAAGPNYWLDFQFLDTDNAYLCWQGLILRTANGGNTWDTVVYDKNQRFIELEFLDAHHGAAVTESGFAYIYKN